MKKLAFIALLLCVALTLSACADTSSADTSVDDTANTTTSTSAEENEDDENTDDNEKENIDDEQETENTDKTEITPPEDRNDTLFKTQEEYEALVSESEDDETAIENVCSVYIAVSRAYVRAPELYSNSIFISDEGLENPTIQYHMSNFEYLRRLYEETGSIVYDDISFSDFSVTVDGDTASASIVESYEYLLDDEFNSECSRTRKYFFELSKNVNGWEIDSITTNDPWELWEGFEYEPIDVEARIKDVTTIYTD